MIGSYVGIIKMDLIKFLRGTRKYLIFKENDTVIKSLKGGVYTEIRKGDMFLFVNMFRGKNTYIIEVANKDGRIITANPEWFEICKEENEAKELDNYNLKANERRLILKALEKTGGVQVLAADLLGLTHRALHYKIHTVHKITEFKYRIN